MKLFRLLTIFVLTGTLLFICQTAAGQSSQFEKFNYISPVPGSKFINPENNIAFRHGDKLDHNSISNAMIEVEGTISGKISGHLKLSLDSRTLIFLPDTPFKYGEKITVKLSSGLKTIDGIELQEIEFSFYTMKSDNSLLLQKIIQEEELESDAIEAETSTNSEENICTPYQSSTNNRDYPEGFVVPMINALDNPSPGYVFATPGRRNVVYWTMMLDAYGIPVFYREWPANCNDFKTAVHNQLMHGRMGHENSLDNCILVLDSHFNPVDSLRPGNGYSIDGHDALLFENGNHILFAKDPQIVGMDTVVPGGDPNATVVGFIVQELDADHNVIFQWSSWDHIAITDGVGVDFTKAEIDHIHMNAVEIDLDNNILLCNRHMEEITKIDRNSGEIIWRFGPNSKNNMFTFLNDTIGFSHQHDVRILENGNMTLYDNGNLHDPGFSQGLEYQLDQTNLTAHMVWNYIRDPLVYSRSRGGTRRLSNGNTIIGWGASTQPSGTEVTHEGHIAWEVFFPNQHPSYRVMKFEWATDMFEPSHDTIDFGVYDEYVPWPRIFSVTNNCDQDIEITSVHNHWDSYYVSTPLPLSIPAGETKNMTVNFFPTMQGRINDVLTLNYESFFADTMPQLIARQIYLTGFVADPNAPTANISPVNGSTEVSQDEQVIISFNEPVVKTNGSTINASDIPAMIEFKEDNESGEDVAFSVYINPWKTEIVITPDYLKPLQQYYFKLKGNVVADGSGNVLNQASESTFTTADEEAPSVTIIPEDEAIDVSTLTMITFTFDEAVVLAEGGEITNDDIPYLINLKENDEEGEDVGFTGTINDEKTLITIVPDSLMILQQYFTELLGGLVADEYGNVIDASQKSTFATADDTGIDDNPLMDLVKVFPNPTNGQLTLVCDINGSKDIQIMNAIGKVIYDQENIIDKVHHIDIGDQPEGIYIVRIILTDSNQVLEIKTIKM